MDFISNQAPQIKEMLAEIGLNDVESLFQDIPKSLRLDKPTIDDGLSEFEGMRLMEAIASKNTFPKYISYLGAGSYEHHVPTLVGAICSKSEFLTSYTPYQPEASQGMLQAIFEFQTAICELTGLDVANASLYDAATACAEAALMALRIQPGKNKIIVAESLHPHFQSVIEVFLKSHEIEIQKIPFDLKGNLDLGKAKNLIDNSTAAVILQYPNFLGVIDPIGTLSEIAKSKEALTILCANPLVYGLFASAGELKADIAVGDTQPFGLPLQFGGPYCGYLACRKELIRQMPGRIVGETLDVEGKRGFVLTLQAREQHIRREKATSNICTNQSLAALASLVSMLWYGKEGIRKLALTNYQRCAYLREHLQKIPGVSLVGSPVFNEFAVTFNKPLEKIFEVFRQHGIAPGIDVSQFYPQLKNTMLIAVTETKTKEMLDHYLKVARLVLEGPP